MTLHLVQVWFGEHLVIEHVDEQKVAAAAYEQAMRRRYPSMRVTISEQVAEPNELVSL